VSPDHWERVRAIFQGAIERTDEGRAAFLSEACQADEAIRREVESLIAAHEAAGAFLETPASRLTADSTAPALQPGDRIGGFEVMGVLGHGGMGEVYRARDAQLGREVAIKVLPRALAADPRRLARFDRESRILATFNHPQIAAIHSVEHLDDQRLLVLELVEGPTLADRLRAGPLPPDEALAIARHLAGALEAAHGRGVVHRDLKPANIKLTSSSDIKLLDFGLAKELLGHDEARSRAPDGSAEGVILGTPAYMSPEQARGQPTDKRTDIWGFGCVLFEMLAGARAFPGATTSDTIAAVLEREPDWSRLPDATAPAILRLLRRCLEKEPTRRLHDIADARIEIDDAASSRQDAPSSARPRARVKTAAVVLVLCAGSFALGWLRSGARGGIEPASRTSRFTWTLPDGLGLDSPPTVSPDGQRIAFTARPGAGGVTTLYVRPLSQLAAEPVPGTEGAKQPFWSPDSRSLAYFARRKLMKVALGGGTPVEICAAPDGRGGAWSATGVIVFAPSQIESGLMRVAEGGGPAEPATLLDVEQGENSHRWPVFLPDGTHFLYFVRSLNDERRGVYLGRVDRPASTPGAALLRSESGAVYAPLDGPERGVLLTAADGRTEARPFDARRRLLTGDPIATDLPAAGHTTHYAMMLSASADVIAHAGSAVPSGVRRASVGRKGEDPILGDERTVQGSPRLSPDGRRLAFVRMDEAPGSVDVWVEDLVRGTRVRVTRSPIPVRPVWSPDGERLAHLARSHQKSAIAIARADGTGLVSTVECPRRRCEPTDWSPDGRWLLATVLEDRDQDVWMLPVGSDEKARPLLAEPFPEHDARFSPNGRLVVYASEETGRSEISVRMLDTPARREVLSVGGGDQPVWGRSGRELFYVDPQGRLRSASFSMGADGRPVIGAAELLDVPPIGQGHASAAYDVSPDGRRIHYFDRRLDAAPTQFGVVVGWRRMWSSGVKAGAPARP
jgi:serine/threonine protein kinase/Tol biopolymer transport system component